jgi:hypothetical protein
MRNSGCEEGRPQRATGVEPCAQRNLTEVRNAGHIAINCERFVREMPMSLLRRAVLLVGLLSLAPAAAAQPVLPGPTPSPAPSPVPAPGPAPGGLIAKITPQQLAQLLTQLKVNGAPLQPTIKTFPGKDYAIVAVPVWPQVFSGVLMNLCESDGSGCRVLRFFANVGKQPTVDAAWINAYHANHWGVMAFTAEGGVLIFFHDVPLFSGVPQDYIINNAAFFKNAVDEAFKYKPR